MTEQPNDPQQPTASDSGVVRQTFIKQPATREQIPATEAIEADLRSINAETVTMEKSGSEGITASRVSMDRSGSKNIDAKSVQMDRSGTLSLSSAHTVLMKSSAVQVVADDVHATDSGIIFLNSDNATIENSRIAVFAGKTTGDVQALITSRTVGMLLGGLAALAFLLRLTRRR